MFLRDKIKNKDNSSQTKNLFKILKIEETFSSTRTNQDLLLFKTNPNIISFSKESNPKQISKILSHHSLPPSKDIKHLVSVELSPHPSSIYSFQNWRFDIFIPLDFPYSPPKVRIRNKIYHPNISESGAVCLNILGLDWSAILTLEDVVIGILDVLIEPNPNDPLNFDAGKLYTENYGKFLEKIKLDIGLKY